MADRADCACFIPIRKSELTDLLCRQPGLADADRDLFRKLCRLLDATIHFENQSRLEELKNAYSHFDPDTDTRRLSSQSEAALEVQMDKLFGNFVELLERANFVRLSRANITEALAAASDWGLNLSVDFDVFDRLEIFARGDIVGTRTRRNWRTRFQPVDVSVPVYQRLVLILKIRDWKNLGQTVDTKSVYIKVFKDIPKLDLEMLLPGTQVKLSLFDRGRILLPTLSGVAMTAWKVTQGALAVAAAGFYSSLAFLGLVGGTLGYGLRSFYGYLQTKQKYQLNLTQSLYYQNLDNNAGAIFMLLNEAEEQEFRETALAYFMLLVRAPKDGWTREQLDDEVEVFLSKATGLEVDFEIGDAYEKLVRYQLVEQCGNGRVRAVPLHTALESLDQMWDNAFDYNQTSSTSTKRKAA